MYKHAYKQKCKHDNNTVDYNGFYSRAYSFCKLNEMFLPREPKTANDGYRQLSLVTELQRKTLLHQGFLACSLRTYKQIYKQKYKHFAERGML